MIQGGRDLSINKLAIRDNVLSSRLDKYNIIYATTLLTGFEHDTAVRRACPPPGIVIPRQAIGGRGGIIRPIEPGLGFPRLGTLEVHQPEMTIRQHPYTGHDAPTSTTAIIIDLVQSEREGVIDP